MNEILNGVLPCHSNFGSFLYAQLGNLQSGYEKTIEFMDKSQAVDGYLKKFTTTYNVSSLIRMIHRFPLEDDAEILTPNVPPPDRLTTEYLSMLDEKRGDIVAEHFFQSMVSLDLDACLSSFNGYKPRMIFPVLIPVEVADGIKPYMATPERQFLNFLYCVAMSEESPKSLDKMFDGFDESQVDSYKSKLRRGTMRLDDYQKLGELWLKLGPRHLESIEITEIEMKRRHTLFLIFYTTTRVFSFVFKDIRRTDDQSALLQRFYNSYYAAWCTEIAKRNISLSEGKDWDDRLVVRLIRDSVTLPAVPA